MNNNIRISTNTGYFKLLQDSNQTIGVTHHKTGMGKLKVNDGGVEYGIPLMDITSKPLSKWRIERR
jgi:hypothetical protein